MDKNENENVIGKWIRYYRTLRVMTQKELADKINVRYQTLQFWETGKRKPKIDNIKKIADALEVPWQNLINENPPLLYDDCMEIAAGELREAARNRPKSPEEEKDIRTDLRAEKRFLLKKSEELAEKYNLPYQSILKNSCMDLFFFGDDYDIEEEAYELVDKLIKLLRSMNDKGREAVLHHAEELSMIPEYKKE